MKFSESIGSLHVEYALTSRDDSSDPDEERFVTLGLGTKGRLVVVVFCYREKDIRIISARPADAGEIEQYEANR